MKIKTSPKAKLLYFLLALVLAAGFQKNSLADGQILLGLSTEVSDDPGVRSRFFTSGGQPVNIPSPLEIEDDFQTDGDAFVGDNTASEASVFFDVTGDGGEVGVKTRFFAGTGGGKFLAFFDEDDNWLFAIPIDKNPATQNSQFRIFPEMNTVTDRTPRDIELLLGGNGTATSSARLTWRIHKVQPVPYDGITPGPGNDWIDLLTGTAPVVSLQRIFLSSGLATSFGNFAVSIRGGGIGIGDSGNPISFFTNGFVGSNDVDDQADYRLLFRYGQGNVDALVRPMTVAASTVTTGATDATLGPSYSEHYTHAGTHPTYVVDGGGVNTPFGPTGWCRGGPSGGNGCQGQVAGDPTNPVAWTQDLDATSSYRIGTVYGREGTEARHEVVRPVAQSPKFFEENIPAQNRGGFLEGAGTQLFAYHGHKRILADASSNVVTVFISHTCNADSDGYTHWIRRVDPTNDVVINPSGGSLINGAATYSFNTAGVEGAKITCRGSGSYAGWWTEY